MRNFSFLVLASLVVAAGCDGCAFPFSTSSTGTIRLSLHGTNEECVDAQDWDPRDNGTPNDPDDDYEVRWDHALDAPDTDEDNDCELESGWRGVLLSMTSVRDSVNEAVTDAGFDPATVQVKLTSLAIDIDDVVLIDDVAGPDDEEISSEVMALVRSYQGSVRPEGETDALITVTTEGGSAVDPITSVSDTQLLTDLANDALANNTNVAGEGDATAVIDFDDQTAFTTFVGLENPTLLVTMTIGVNGDAIVGGPPPASEE